MNAGEKTPVPLVVTPTTKPENSGGPLELEEIKVVAESESPYKKTLTGVFKRQLGNQYVVEDEAGHIAAVLTMVCGDGEKDIRITLPSGVIPDEADIRIKDYKDDQCTFRSPGYGIYSLVLLKSEDDIIAVSYTHLNQFVVNVFTNGADPEWERRDTQETDMDYIEFCREVFRIRQKMQQNISPKEE